MLVAGVLSVVLVGLPTAAGAVPIPWKNCGNVSDLIAVTRVESSVWPPVAGQSITIESQFVLRQHIWGGSAVMDASTRQPGPPTWPQDTSFGPEDAGPYNHLVTLNVPIQAGGQVFNVTFRAYGPDHSQLICVQATVPVKQGAAPVNPASSQPSFDDSPAPEYFLWRLFQNFLPNSERYGSDRPF